MLSRRSLLIGAGLLTGQLLAGCQANRSALRVHLLANSIPAQLLGLFQQQLDQSELDVVSVQQIADLYEQLQAWKQPQPDPPQFSLPFNLPFTSAKPTAVADLITIGDAWLAAAIQRQLVQPIDIAQLPGWQQLSPQWQTLVQRDRQGNVDAGGEIWAAPYRWGTLAIAYNRQRFQQLDWTPRDWSDLWRPELQGKISLLDSPRTAIGLTLKKLGRSFNEADLNRSKLKSEFQMLHQQVKFYSSDAYLQPLLLGDTWAAVGWSADLLPVLKRDRRIVAVVPKSGTLLSADLWVRPVTADQASAAANQWVDFYWQPEVATQLSVLSSAVSPILSNPTEPERVNLPTALRNDSLRLPPLEVMQRSEFLQPIAAATVEQYLRLWTATRQGS